jgi:transcriptional accessory protein Tex/SPT6
LQAKNDDLIEISLHIQTDTSGEGNSLFLELTKEPVFNREEYYYVAEEWNKLRKEVLRVCVNDILMPVFEREAHEKLLEEARDCVFRVCKIIFIF